MCNDVLGRKYFMEGRGLTNLLLAIIAGALLFGKDAIVGGLQGASIALIAIFVIFLVLAGVGALLGAISQSYRESKDVKEVLLITFGLVAAAVLASLLAYAGLLWLDGDKRPFDAAMVSWFGKAWTGVLLAGFAGIAIYTAQNAFLWMRENWHDRRYYIHLSARFVGTWAIAPAAFPIREWRIKRAEGSGVFVSFFSSAFAAVIGLVIWSMLWGLVMFILSGLGVIA
jgi:MFS family permease